MTDPKVSKHHAEIRPEGDGWTIRDTRSRNGVTVNGLRIDESALKNGDRVMIGPYLIVFECHLGDGTWMPIQEIDFSTNVGQQTIPSVPPRDTDS